MNPTTCDQSRGCTSARRLVLCALVSWGVLPLSIVTAQSERPAAADDTYNVLFLAADGPVWLTLQFEGAHQGAGAVRERYARLLIDTVDANDDSFAGADEAPKLPSSGRAGSDGELLGDRWMEFDTSPQDGRLSPEEYLAVINPRLGPRFTARRKPPLLVQSVQLLPRLDLDRDRKISAAEIDQATQTLRQFDFDDDGTFSPAELQPFPQSMVDAAMAQANGVGEQPFVIVNASTDATALATRMMTLYANGAGIPPERSGLSEFAFREMDLDDDGLLDASELLPFIERPRPIAEIGIDLSAGRATLKRSRRGSSFIDVLPVDSPRRLALRLGSEVVEFSARDNRYEASDQINLLRVRFLQGDADKNGYMGPQEFVSLAGMDSPFEDVDADADGKVFIEELDRFIRMDSYLTQCALEMEVETVEKPLFRILDENLDRRLTSREFAAGSGRLQEFDEDGDGILDARELDLLRRFRVRFAFVVPPAVRPERTSQMMANQRMPVVSRLRQSGPQWFQNMDRNQDGDVTWREFLGPREAFMRLDRDQNGWIDEAEASDFESADRESQ